VSTATGDAVHAPMQATVVKLAVAEGDIVVKGDLLLVLEAMKMEQPLTAHKDGMIGSIEALVGATVASGSLLMSLTDQLV
jgi:acetyl-CoA/propionyl-CoA carboxylase biotin carboxyl carrier protein